MIQLSASAGWVFDLLGLREDHCSRRALTDPIGDGASTCQQGEPALAGSVLLFR
jgi:hypothetical protein